MSRASTERTSTAARRVLVAATAAVCLGFASAPAAVAATVTIGAPDVSSTQGLNECPDMMACTRTLVQLIQPTPGALLTAPADGVITSWRVHGNTAQSVNGALALRVLHRDPDGVRFTGVATSAGVTASFDDGSPPHTVSIPVQAGDYIGVDLSRAASSIVGAPVFVYTSQPSGATYGVWEGGLSNGLTMAPSSTVAERLMLNAVESLRPAVSGVSPSSGSTAGGEAVTITGSNLDGASGVSFGGTPASSFTAVSATQIKAMAPARAQGTIDVQVTGPGGVSPTTAADNYSYVAPAPILGAGSVAATPIVSAASETAETWRENNTLPHISATKKLPVGTTFSFTLNEPATVTLRFTQKASGHMVQRKCVAPSAKNGHKPRCTRAIAAGSFTLAGHLGTNRVRFAGRVSHTNKLKPGRYTLQITATNTQGEHSAPQSLTFTIVK
jgi:hypothetical protein